MTSNKTTPWIGHGIRWLLIAAALAFIARVSYGPEPWKLPSVTRQALNAMELPDATIVSMSPSERGIRSILLVNREHGMYHQIFASRKLGMFWSAGGGSSVLSLDPGIKVEFRGGLSTMGGYRYYYYIGQANDPAIDRLQVIWFDGFSQDAILQDGIYHVTRALPTVTAYKPPTQTGKDTLIAYDAQGRILYKLTPEQSEAR